MTDHYNQPPVGVPPPQGFFPTPLSSCWTFGFVKLLWSCGNRLSTRGVSTAGRSAARLPTAGLPTAKLSSSVCAAISSTTAESAAASTEQYYWVSTRMVRQNNFYFINWDTIPLIYKNQAYHIFCHTTLILIPLFVCYQIESHVLKLEYSSSRTWLFILFSALSIYLSLLIIDIAFFRMNMLTFKHWTDTGYRLHCIVKAIEFGKQHGGFSPSFVSIK